MSFEVPHFPLLPMTNVFTSFPLAYLKFLQQHYPWNVLCVRFGYLMIQLFPYIREAVICLTSLVLLIENVYPFGIEGHDNFIVDVHPINAYSNNLLSFPHHKIYI